MANYVRTSDPAFAAGLFDLPTPPPLEFFVRYGSLPLDNGLYEFGYSFVAENGDLTDMGPTVQVQLKKNSNYGVRFAHDTWTRAVGIMLWSRRIDGTPGVTAHEIEYDWRPAGAQIDCNNAQSTPKPYLPMCGWENHILQAQEIHRCVRLVAGQGWSRYEDLPRSPAAAPLYSPTILPYHVPSCGYDVRLRLIGSHGVSLPSQPVTVPADNPGDHHAPFVVRMFDRFQGVRGYFLEAKPEGTLQWYRQKNPSQTGHEWPAALTHFELKNYSEGMPISDTEAPGQTWLSSGQRALSESTKSIIMDEDQVTYSPMFNGTDNGQGTAINRTIQGEQGLPWKIIPMHSQAAWIEGSNGTIVNGIRIESPTAECGIDFCAHNDSAAFAPRINNPIISLTRTGYTAGIRQLLDAKSINNHTASEVIITNPKITAAHPYVCEGTQSANWEIRDNNSNAGDNCCHASVANSGSFRFTGQTIMEGGRAPLALISARLVEIENLFSDRGFPAYCVVSNRTSPVIRIKCAVPNQRLSWLHLIEAACAGRETIDFELAGRIDATDVDELSFTTRYEGIQALQDSYCRFKSSHILMPTLSWWKKELADFVNAKSYFDVWDNGVDIEVVPD